MNNFDLNQNYWLNIITTPLSNFKIITPTLPQFFSEFRITITTNIENPKFISYFERLIYDQFNSYYNLKIDPDIMKLNLTSKNYVQFIRKEDFHRQRLRLQSNIFNLNFFKQYYNDCFSKINNIINSMILPQEIKESVFFDISLSIFFNENNISMLKLLQQNKKFSICL
jgi:hypothetical protein